MLLTRRPPNTAPRPASARPMSRAAATWLTAAGVVLIALNLRLGISSTSALLEQLRAELGFGPLVASLVPALPTLCFAAVGATSAMLARRVGTERAVLLALSVLSAGLAVRAVPRTGALLAGTLLGAAGLALCNVLLPAVVKAHFPARVALMTGVYTTTMALGSAVAAAAAVPVADLAGEPRRGWRPGPCPPCSPWPYGRCGRAPGGPQRGVRTAARSRRGAPGAPASGCW